MNLLLTSSVNLFIYINHKLIFVSHFSYSKEKLLPGGMFVHV